MMLPDKPQRDYKNYSPEALTTVFIGCYLPVALIILAIAFGLAVRIFMLVSGM